MAIAHAVRQSELRPPLRNRLQALHGRDATQAYLMIAPAVLLLVVLVAYPFMLSLWLSMTNKSVGNPAEFVGLRNFTTQLDSQIFRQAFRNTIWYTAVTTVVKLVLGFALALLLNREFRGRKFVRAAMLLPWIVPSVLSTMAWLWLLESNLSSVNWALKHAHIIRKSIPFLTDPGWAMASVMTVNVWRGTPFLGITILAALQTIPRELYEAAELDGATPFQRIRAITLPQMYPTMIMTFILQVIAVVQIFTEPFLLTQGGPANATLTPVLVIYRKAFQDGDFGLASAWSLSLIIVLSIFSAIYLRFTRRSV